MIVGYRQEKCKTQHNKNKPQPPDTLIDDRSESWVASPSASMVSNSRDCTYIGRAIIECLRVAHHGLALALVDMRHDALLVHGHELMFLCGTLLLQTLHCLLEPQCHTLLELLGRVRVAGTHVLVPLLQV